MFTIRTAEISEHCGNAGDGFVRGAVAQSLSTDVMTTIESVEPVFAFNLDLSGGMIDFTDESAHATSGSAIFRPWGTNSSFSLGDCLYIASTEPVTQIRFIINTGAVWTSGTPSAVQLTVKDSTNGTTANRQLTVTTDTSNGFRSTGTVVIEWTDPVIPRVAWTPVPGLIDPHEWICISPTDFSVGGTAPVMSMTYMLGSGNDFSDETTIFNDAWLTPVPNTLPDVVYFPGACTLFTFAAPGPGLDLRVYRKSANYYTYILEYYSTSGVWQPFTNVTDPSDWMKNGPAVYNVNPQDFYIRWRLPSDWGAMPLTIPIDTSPYTVTLHGAHMRSRIVTVLNSGPTPPPLARARCRSLNVAGGVYHLAQGVYNALTFEATIPALLNTDIQLFNGSTLASAIATLPANTYSSCNTTLQRVPLSNTLQINANEPLYITWQNGAVLQDVELVLE